MSVNDTERDQPISPRLPRYWTWIAASVILLFGAVGFLRGVGGSKPLAAILAPGRAPLAITPVTSTDAAPLPHNDDWSVLSGPKILPPAAPKPVKVASSDDDDESDSAADQSAAAAQVDAQAPDDVAAPTPPPTDPPAPPPAPPD